MPLAIRTAAHTTVYYIQLSLAISTHNIYNHPFYWTVSGSSTRESMVDLTCYGSHQAVLMEGRGLCVGLCFGFGSLPGNEFAFFAGWEMLGHVMVVRGCAWLCFTCWTLRFESFILGLEDFVEK